MGLLRWRRVHLTTTLAIVTRVEGGSFSELGTRFRTVRSCTLDAAHQLCNTRGAFISAQLEAVNPDCRPQL
eukprot:4017193-Pyramimonas_sp.AAC.1